ncbi:MAG: HDOD domain-containing protein [Gammaproteobacteria bacterium]|nr:HDOD domain-containing protein [Gammaproteobacteria bacterium]
MNIIPSESELNQAFDAIQGIRIPKIPDAVLALKQELLKQEPNMSDIGQILASDPALSGIALKIINSGKYGLSREIQSISQAAVLLGLNVIQEIILLSALKQAMGQSSPFQTYIWKSSQAIAMGAKALAISVEGVSPESAFLAGLFQNVGALLLDKKYENYSMQYLESLANPITCLKLEEEQYNTNHATISFLLAKHWRLPEKVGISIYHSHAETCLGLDDPEIKGLIAILKICENSTSHILDSGLKFTPEGTKAVANSYLELALDTDAIKEMNYELRQVSN